MKKKTIIFVILGILLIIAAIVGIVYFTNKKDAKYLIDDSIENGVACEIEKANIINEKEIKYQKGDRINIYLNDESEEYDYENKPYMENVLINDIEDDYIIIWIPFEYKAFTIFANRSPIITMKISNASDEKRQFKGNRELRDLLNNKYAMPEEK